MMKKITLLLIVLGISSPVYADKGVVIKQDVCGSGNSIIKTTDGWYVAAEYYSGVNLYQGDIVFGNLKTYGSEEITRNDGQSGNFYIEDYESNIGDAYEELCG